MPSAPLWGAGITGTEKKVAQWGVTVKVSQFSAPLLPPTMPGKNEKRLIVECSVLMNVVVRNVRTQPTCPVAPDSVQTL